ncbi:MAG: hypothetical protein J2P37_00680 [Ktedonobacteraceae bacterium]|nr:hypothetical protein [Ktedonobacteraceae bacterium]MBO0793491.1 hypothetical protein [Ktedonobacteraceae bacterium]
MSVDGAQAWFNVTPDLPTNLAVPQGLAPQVLMDNRGKEAAQDITKFFIDQLKVATPMWNSPVESFATDQLTHAFERIMKKIDKPRAALQVAQKACQANLEQALKQK